MLDSEMIRREHFVAIVVLPLASKSKVHDWGQSMVMVFGTQRSIELYRNDHLGNEAVLSMDFQFRRAAKKEKPIFGCFEDVAPVFPLELYKTKKALAKAHLSFSWYTVYMGVRGVMHVSGLVFSKEDFLWEM
jgi:hypothetical protein